MTGSRSLCRSAWHVRPRLVRSGRRADRRRAWAGARRCSQWRSGLGGCQAPGLPDLGPTALRSPGPVPSDPAALRAYAEDLGQRYDAHPDDKGTGLGYARALKGQAQYAQAAAVLQRIGGQAPARPRRPRRPTARRWPTPAGCRRPPPCWSGATRRSGRTGPCCRRRAPSPTSSATTRRRRAYYAAALKIAPDQPQVLSNLGLSYALERQMPNAESTLRTAAAQPGADMRVRQNLALVLALQGKFGEAEDVSRRDLAADRRRGQRRRHPPDDRAFGRVARRRERARAARRWRSPRRAGPARSRAPTRPAPERPVLTA